MLINLLWVLYLFVCLILMLIILLQRGEAGGLGAAFGGGGGDTAFGVKADVTWKKATAFFAGLFLVMALGLSFFMGRSRETTVTKPSGGGEPAASATPEPSAGDALDQAAGGAPAETPTDEGQ